MRRAIERYLEDPLAEHLLREEFEAGKLWVEKQGEGDDAKLGLIDAAVATERREGPLRVC